MEIFSNPSHTEKFQKACRALAKEFKRDRGERAVEKRHPARISEL